MTAVRLLVFVVLAVVLWLAFLQPSLALQGNLLLFVLATGLLAGMVWHRALIGLVRGDAYTYGLVSAAINALFSLLALALIAVAYRIVDARAQSPLDVPGLIWAALMLLVLAAWALPLLTVRRQDELPRADARRTLDGPDGR